MRRLVSIATAVCYVMALCVRKDAFAASSVPIQNQAHYSLHRGTALPLSLIISTQTISSVVRCASLCATTSGCVSFYLEDDSIGLVGNDHWKCSLLLALVKVGQLTGGSGVVGIPTSHVVEVDSTTKSLKLSSDDSSESDTTDAPALPSSIFNGTFLFYTTLNHLDVAVFNCSSVNPNMTSIGIVVDGKDAALPSLHSTCASNEDICQLTGFSETAVKIQETFSGDEHTFTYMTPFCQLGEYMWGIAMYGKGGGWFARQPHQVGCVPTACYRYGNDGHVVYNGTLAESRNEVPCQPLGSQTPNAHSLKEAQFPMDGHSLQAASNYCRDPTGLGRPWCFQTWGDAWDFCDIPLCRYLT